MCRSGLGSLGVKQSTSVVSRESAIKAAGLLTARQASETPSWEHGTLNNSGHRQLNTCKPVITELVSCRTVRQCHSLLILSFTKKMQFVQPTDTSMSQS